ncbi:MAG: hypothetical protein QM817_31575 [Archangium sp.]
MRSLLIASCAALALMSGCVRYVYGISETVSSTPVPDVSGPWNTKWIGGGDYVAVVTMVQQGERVTATYTTTARPEPGVEGTIEGSFEGTITGNELRGRWDEGGDRYGRMRFVFRADGHSFEGTWGHGDQDDDGGEWDGTR